MRRKPAHGNAWTTVRVRELRERLGIGAFDPTPPRAETISADAAAIRLGSASGRSTSRSARAFFPQRS
jgi:hypothetical protein